MIVAPETLATEAGLEVLQRGGNAVDAAVTAAFVQGVVSPLSTGLGGWGLMVVHRAGEGAQHFLDFQARAGAGVREDQWASLFLGQTPEKNLFRVEGGLNDVGYGSIAVPGTVRGLAEALERFGTIDWRQALEPALSLARAGVRGNRSLLDNNVRAPGSLDRLRATAESARLFTRAGDVLAVGDRLDTGDLAHTLARLAEAGPDDFYEGEIAERMAADLAAGGSTVTAQDLRDYRPRLSSPLRSTYRGLDVVTAPAPAGGVALVQMLNFLEGFEAGSPVAGADAAERVAAAMAWAFRDRDELLGDPAFTAVPAERLASKAYAAEARARFQAGDRFLPVGRLGETGTTHISVVDGYGDAVALTTTLGAYSGVVTPGLGFMFNNHLALFDPRPGRANSLAPGKTRITMMAPTLVLEAGRPRIVAGARGGTRIVGTILQVLLHLIDAGAGVLEAVCAPRIDCQGDAVVLEGRIPTAVARELAARGWRVDHLAESWSPYFAKGQVVQIASDGSCAGASDPRGDGGFALGLP